MMNYDTLDNMPTMDGGEHEGRLLAERYRIVRKLGEGGMGLVYLAEDTELETRVAIKFVPPMLAGNARAIKNLQREAATAMQLSHPHIVRLHDLHTDGHQKFLVMEYIEGKTLEDLLAEKEDDRLSFEEVLPVARQVADALDFAHQRNVLHRDLKPSNIMITAGGEAKLLDFGIARELKDSYTRVTGHETSGTLPYMSPEQLQGQTPSPQMDIYSLAAVLYECLCGHAPFYTGDLRHQILEVEPRPLDLPQAAGLLHALAKDPAQRPASGSELVALLSGSVPAPVASHERKGPRQVEPSPGQSAAKSPRQSPLRRMLLAGWLLLIVGGVAVMLWVRFGPVPDPSSDPPPPSAHGPGDREAMPASTKSAVPVHDTGMTESGKGGGSLVGEGKAVEPVILLGQSPGDKSEQASDKADGELAYVPPPKGSLFDADYTPLPESRGPVPAEPIIRNNNHLRMNMVWITAGNFTMGSHETEDGRQRDEGPVHAVTIDQDFWMGKTEVTVGQFRRFVEATGYQTEAEKQGGAYGITRWSAPPAGQAKAAKGEEPLPGRIEGLSWRDPGYLQIDIEPVVCVSWNDASAFCRWLSEQDKVTVRLPTEAEWEYACRAGTQSAYAWGNQPGEGHAFCNAADLKAKEVFSDLRTFDWYDGVTFTASVGALNANPWGLHDMHGNVWEWVQDDYADRYASDRGTGAQGAQGASGTAALRVMRGGSWKTGPAQVRSAERHRGRPDAAYNDVGFRVVMEK
jgi:formylglycine-generating enzyme required for sulfatase activity/predicted Ser/Thr protein kinase